VAQLSRPLEVLLLSTYELGHQPFGLASPATWLREQGASVRTLDLAVQQVDEAAIKAADLIAFYVPMHTATRLATNLVRRVKTLNPHAHLCFYGLYAPVNESYLRKLGADSIIGGEFEEEMETLVNRLTGEVGRAELFDTVSEAPTVETTTPDSSSDAGGSQVFISLSRLQFRVPDRSDMPSLDQYAYLTLHDGERRVVGYTEGTRGCKHLCRHCPIVPVYNGHFRVVQHDVVMADIATGAQHISFGDPDFFNGPAHALAIVRDLHERWPDLTYDVIIKVEHLLKHARHLPTLRDTGCLFVTSAVESVDDTTLMNFDKRHTREEFVEAVRLFREIGLGLNPTFVTFTPWTTPENYFDLLQTIAELDLVENVAPIQYAIRLLIPNGSRLLELPEVQELVGEYDEEALAYPWRHPDPRVDQLYDDVMEAVKQGMRTEAGRPETFAEVWRVAGMALARVTGGDVPPLPPRLDVTSLVPVPHLSEPWYCCAEPTEEQLAPSV
jgi:radical SAM superfamily enzyme YgiQ (UPF0313 family)